MSLPEQGKKHLLFESNTGKQTAQVGTEPAFREGHRSELSGFHSLSGPTTVYHCTPKVHKEHMKCQSKQGKIRAAFIIGTELSTQGPEKNAPNFRGSGLFVCLF